MGEVDFMMVNKLASDMGPVFDRSIDILKGMKMPTEAHNVIRNQYYATVILSKLERAKANTREQVIGVCEEDLYLPEDAYVLGHADILSGTAVISLFQIRQEFYGLMAHLFNLSECRNPKCINYFSQVMLDIDSKSEKFCDICRRKLTTLV